MKQRFKSLKSGGGKKLFVQAFTLMLLVRLGLLLLPFSQLQNLIEQTKSWKFLAFDAQNVTTRAIVLAIHRSAKYGPGTTKCLARALTTGVLMSRYGFPYQIKIGVAKGKNNQLEAHAWVESKGAVIVGDLPDLSRYIAMSSTERSLII